MANIFIVFTNLDYLNIYANLFSWKNSYDSSLSYKDLKFQIFELNMAENFKFEVNMTENRQFMS